MIKLALAVIGFAEDKKTRSEGIDVTRHTNPLPLPQRLHGLTKTRNLQYKRRLVLPTKQFQGRLNGFQYRGELFGRKSVFASGSTTPAIHRPLHSLQRSAKSERKPSGTFPAVSMSHALIQRVGLLSGCTNTFFGKYTQQNLMKSICGL